MASGDSTLSHYTTLSFSELSSDLRYELSGWKEIPQERSSELTAFCPCVHAWLYACVYTWVCVRVCVHVCWLWTPGLFVLIYALEFFVFEEGSPASQGWPLGCYGENRRHFLNSPAHPMMHYKAGVCSRGREGGEQFSFRRVIRAIKM